MYIIIIISFALAWESNPLANIWRNPCRNVSLGRTFDIKKNAKYRKISPPPPLLLPLHTSIHTVWFLGISLTVQPKQIPNPIECVWNSSCSPFSPGCATHQTRSFRMNKSGLTDKRLNFQSIVKSQNRYIEKEKKPKRRLPESTLAHTHTKFYSTFHSSSWNYFVDKLCVRELNGFCWIICLRCEHIEWNSFKHFKQAKQIKMELFMTSALYS